MKTEEILAKAGWTIECESPWEIRHKETGSTATGLAAHMVITDIVKDVLTPDRFTLVQLEKQDGEAAVSLYPGLDKFLKSYEEVRAIKNERETPDLSLSVFEMCALDEHAYLAALAQNADEDGECNQEVF